MSQRCLSQIEEFASKLDTSTVRDSGFPKFVKPLITPVKNSANGLTIDVNRIFYGLENADQYGYDALLRNYFITPKRIARLLTQTINERILSSYFGIEVSGPDVHIGHLIPTLALGNLRQIYKGRIRLNILLADEHTKKSKNLPEDHIRFNTTSLKEQFSRLFPFAEIVVGSEFQFNREYIDAVRAIKRHVPLPQAIKALPALTRKPLLDDRILERLLEEKGLRELTVEKQFQTLKARLRTYSTMNEITLAMVDYTTDQATDPAFAGGTRDSAGNYVPGPIDIAFAGGDQRGPSVMTEEKIAYIMKQKPSIILAPLLSSLSGEDRKMSKSDFVEGNEKGVIWLKDSPDLIRKKLNRAYCPETTRKNPVIDLYRLVIFPFYEKILMKESDEYKGAIKEFKPEDFLVAYNQKRLDIACVRDAAAIYLSSVLGSLNK